ncbi:hypothetical protein K439DRAFT_1647802 [Ramaria rubella]|nr:hypothetical protein K439DRAFT_1647802 [Ramaria rubella]
MRSAQHSETDSETSGSEDEDPPLPQLSSIFLSLLNELHAMPYLWDRIHIPKNGVQLSLMLFCYKAEHPALFQSLLQVTPSTFDALLSKIQDHPVFQSNSEKQQIPVIQQLAVVRLWAGLGYGTVDKCTRRVMTAVWWLMVNGTLVPLFAQLGFYGNTWYNQKSNSSLNVQLISTPNLRIIDYGVGLPGSQHDATAWKGTQIIWIPQEHHRLVGTDGWVWANMAYPLQSWCTSHLFERAIRALRGISKGSMVVFAWIMASH